MPEGCPDENVLVHFAEGLLSAEDAGQVEAHLDTCPDCATVTAEIARALVPTGETPDDGAERERPWLTRGDSVSRYVVLEWLGSGGMGQVYAADDPDLGRRIALKLVRSGGSPELQKKLLREAQAMAQLSHPNVVAVHDVGVVGDRAFIAMELVTGVTLRSWCAGTPRSWRELLAIYIDAGRGLAAAHDAGLVHRDFKPGNVLVRDDGRVQVTDFGLARASEAIEDGEAASLPPDLLLSGTVLAGTPAYMAPEQYRGEAADARTDQFAFCVALHEALYGVHPFAGDDPDDMKARVLDGKARPAPATSIPASARRAIERGLSCEPSSRFESMHDLLAELERAPRQRRRRWLTIAAAAALLVLTGSIWYGSRRPAAQPICQGGTEQVGEVWNEEQRRIIEGRFSATGLPYAGTAWIKTAAALDDYADHYARTHREACEATRVRGHQSDEVLGLRMACLNRRLDELGALIELLATADAGVVENATRAVQTLPGLDNCDALRVIEGRYELPSDPAIRAEISDLFDDLTRAKALRATAKYDEAIPLLEELAEKAARLGFRPLEAEVLDEVTMTRDYAGSMAEEDELHQSLLAARAAGSARFEARAAIALANHLRHDNTNLPAAERWLRYAAATVEYLGGDPSLEAAIEETTAMIADFKGDHDREVVHFRRALEKWKQVKPLPTADIAETHTFLGTALASAGKFDEALRAHQRSMAMLEEQFGRDHPRLMPAVNNLALVYHRLGRLDEAIAMQRRSLVLREQTFGSDNPHVGNALVNLALSLRSRHEYAEAQRLLERALAIFEKEYGPEHRHVGVALVNLGDVLTNSGQPERGAQSIQRAYEIFEKVLGPDHPDVAATLLSLASALFKQKRYRETIAAYERALRIQSERLGEDHPQLAWTLTGWAAVHIRLGAPGKAIPLLERALVLNARTPDSPISGQTQFELARALWKLGRDRKRALKLAQNARETFARSGLTKNTEEVAGWLAEREKPR